MKITKKYIFSLKRQGEKITLKNKATKEDFLNLFEDSKKRNLLINQGINKDGNFCFSSYNYINEEILITYER